MRRWWMLALAIALSGCKVGPNYRPPALDVPKEYRYESESDVDSDWLNLAWWQQFGDPVLDKLIADALLNNKDVQIAAANILNAVGILIQTKAPLYPQAGYSSSYTRTLTSTNIAGGGMVLPNPQTTWQVLLNGSWDLDVWGRTRRLVEAARANLYATFEARQQVILSLVASVANSYIQLRSLDAQLEVAKRTEKSYAEAVTYFEAQFKHGQSSMMAVAGAKTQLEIAAVTIPQIELSIAQTENALSVLLGQNPGPIPRGKDIHDLTLPIVPEGLPSELLRQRPDIMQAEQSLIGANAELGAAIALYFPSISLTEYYGNASQQLHNLFSGPSKAWSFVGSVTGPLFTAGAIYGQVIQARANRKAALINYRRTVQNAFADVEDALVARIKLTSELEARQRLVEASKQYEELANLQYRGGYSPYFVVIQAQQQYFPAELSFVTTRGQLLSSYVDIYQAMGGGWVCVAKQLTGD